MAGLIAAYPSRAIQSWLGPSKPGARAYVRVKRLAVAMIGGRGVFFRHTSMSHTVSI
jgi:hypothetical protein